MDTVKSHMQRVVETVWPWDQPGGSNGPEKQSRWIKGIIQSCITGVIGWIVFRYVGHPVVAVVIWTLALTVLISSFIMAPVFDAIERFGARLGGWAGTGLTYLLLVPFYYLVFVPGHLVLWLKGKDPMHRQFPCPESTCWAPRRTKLHDTHYRKQFS